MNVFYSPVFVWLFLTAWIWAGLISYGCYELAKKGKKYSVWARGAMMLFSVIALQSSFWFLGIILTAVFSLVDFAEVYHWLFGGSFGPAMFWAASAVATLVGVFAEVKNAFYCKEDYFIGTGMAVLITFAATVVFWLYILLSYFVSSIVVLG